MKKLLLSGLKKTRELIDQIESRIKKDVFPPPEHEVPEKGTSIQEDSPVSPIPSLKSVQTSLPGLAPPEISTTDDRKPLNELMRKWGKVSGCTFKESKALVREQAGVVRLDFMTKGQVVEMCSWLAGKIKMFEDCQKKRK